MVFKSKPNALGEKSKTGRCYAVVTVNSSSVCHYSEDLRKEH